MVRVASPSPYAKGTRILAKAVLPRRTAHDFPTGFAEAAGGSVAKGCAIAEMESLVLANLFLASSIRQPVRYSIGDTPTVSLNLSAKVDRDMRHAAPTPRPSNPAPTRPASTKSRRWFANKQIRHTAGNFFMKFPYPSY